MGITVEIVSRSTLMRDVLQQSTVAVNAPSLVHVQAQVSQVQAMERAGEDLLLRMTDGQVVRINGYFTQSGTSLVMDEDEKLVELHLSESASSESSGEPVSLTHASQPLSSQDAQLLSAGQEAQASSDTNSEWGTWAWVGGGLLAAGAIAAAASGGGGGGGGGGNNDTNGSSGGKVTRVTFQVVDDDGKPLADNALTNDRTPTFKGTGEPGATIRILNDETHQLIADTQVQSDGTWSVTLPHQALGQQDYEVVQAVGSRTTEVGEIEFTFTDGPVQPGINAISEDTGTPGDFITSDNTLTLQGTLSEPLDPDEKAQISIDGGVTWTDLAVNNVDWNYVDERVLADGKHTYMVRVIDMEANGTFEIESMQTQVVTVDSSAQKMEPLASLLVPKAVAMQNSISEGINLDDLLPATQDSAPPLSGGHIASLGNHVTDVASLINEQLPSLL